MGEYILLFALLGGGGGGFVHSGGSELEGGGGGRKWSTGAIRSEHVVRTGEGGSMCRICGKIYSKSSPAILHVLVKVNSKKIVHYWRQIVGTLVPNCETSLWLLIKDYRRLTDWSTSSVAQNSKAYFPCPDVKLHQDQEWSLSSVNVTSRQDPCLYRSCLYSTQ